MGNITINVGELRRALREGKDDFKPVVFGREETKKTNEKAYADIKKEAGAYDGGLTKNDRKPGMGIGNDDNKGMHDLTYDNVNKPFKDKVKSQMKGYVSKQAEDLHKDDPFGNADFDKEGKIYKDLKKHADSVKKGKDTATEIGLTGRELDKKEVEKLRHPMGEGRKIKKLTFKNTKFISEGHMLSKVPDEYKKNGNKFVMKDSYDNEYLVEWTNKEPNVTKKTNMSLVNEEKKRIYLEDNGIVKMTKIIIDYQVKSFKELFHYFICIGLIFFKNFYSNNIADMSYMFYRCSSLKELIFLILILII